MNHPEEIRKSLFHHHTTEDFNALAVKIFHYQYQANPVYRQFVDLLKVDPKGISDYHDIPFLPIGFFRDQVILSADNLEYEKVFLSSGTTGMVPSRHYIRDLKVYEESFMGSFSHFYGNPMDYRFLALLPGYLERPDSSLVWMMDHLIRMTRANGSGFYLHDTDALFHELHRRETRERNTLLFGASHALLGFAEKYRLDIEDLIVMETGGMKGRRKEMIREELHQALSERLGVEKIHSEYGMTELLSQAYSKGEGVFYCPPWMKVLTRDVNDPLTLIPAGATGGINIIDLSNLYSCSFIATQDLGKAYEDGAFEVSGRFDDSDIRGCNLLVV